MSESLSSDPGRSRTLSVWFRRPTDIHAGPLLISADDDILICFSC